MTFTDEATWYASLATMYGTAAALITSPSGEVLLVKPNYRELWSLPGGILEDGERPEDGCAAEVREEIGLRVDPGRLLAVHWTAPEGRGPSRRSRSSSMAVNSATSPRSCCRNPNLTVTAWWPRPRCPGTCRRA